jgi:cell division septal protein FtsQ
MRSFVEQKLYDLKSKSEEKGYLVKKFIKLASWKLVSIVILLVGGFIVIIIGFFMGMSKIEAKQNEQ